MSLHSPSGVLRIEASRHPTHQLIRLVGRVGMEEAGELRERLSALADDPGGIMIIDAGELAGLNSMGLGAVVIAHQKLQASGGELRLAAPTEQIRQVLVATALNRVIAIHDSVEAALAGC